jgi:hypothetical protein
MQDTTERTARLAPDQDALMEKFAELAAARLDDERLAGLVERLVSTMVYRADNAPTRLEGGRRRARIQSLIKRL